MANLVYSASVISPLQQQWRQLRRREGEEKARSGEEKSPEWQQQWQRRSSRHLRSPQVRSRFYFLVILSRVHNSFLGILNAFSGVWVEVSLLHLTSCWKGLEVSRKEIAGFVTKTPCNCARCIQKIKTRLWPDLAGNRVHTSSEEEDGGGPPRKDRNPSSAESDEDDLSKIKGDFYGKSGRSKAENGGGKKKKERQQSRKDRDDAMREIRSESSRMLRESAIGLPYHAPKQRTLDEFLNR